MAELTVVILTINEEEMLPTCLSALGWADEILVVDSYSTDKTRRIAAEAGARVLVHKFDNFSDQYNWAFEHCTTPWILVVDADEVVDDKLRASVMDVLNQPNPQFEVYNVVRDAFFLGKRMRSSAWSNEKLPRLFKKGAMRYSGLVHPAPEYGNRRIGTLKGRLHHYTHRTMEQYFDKMRLYSRLWAREAYSRGKKVGIAGIFASTAWRFFHNYFIRGEILDGAYGILASGLSAVYTFDKYTRLWGQWVTDNAAKSARKKDQAD